MSKNKGITLIALIITIIILLILAGISIATLTGQNGLLTKATEAKRITQEEGIKEEIKIAYISVETDAIMNGWDINKKAEELQKELRKEDTTATVTVNGTNLNVSYKGVELTINEKGQIEIAEKVTKLTINEFSIKGTKVTSITPPEGFVHVGGTIDEGYVISDDPTDGNKGVDADLTGNQFVWVPVEKDQKISAKVTSPENIKSLIITDPFGNDIITKNDIGKQYNEQIEPTFNGPYRIIVTTENGETAKSFFNVHSLYAVANYADWWATEEYAKSAGYGNLETMLKNLNYTTKEEFLMNFTLARSPIEIDYGYKDKVNSNGGFYVGRYEAGDSNATGERTSSSKSTGIPVTKKNQFVYNWITQIDALNLAKTYKTDLNSSLLSGAGADRIAGWLCETKEKTISELLIGGKSWGKYDSDTFSNVTGLIKTGIYNQTKANNIYDFAGNVREWPLESSSPSIVNVRDNAFDIEARYAATPMRRGLTTLSSSKAKDIGFRIALYL